MSDELSKQDLLTGLPDRYYLWSLLNDTLKQIQRTRSHCGVLLIHINDLDQLNATLGNSGIEKLLSILTSRIEKTLWDRDVAVRFTDDQFVILANYLNKQEDIHTVMKKIMEYLTLECEIDGQEIIPAVSIGIVNLPTDTAMVDSVMEYASNALHLARLKGKNSYCYYNQELGEKIEEQETVKESIMSTLADENFILNLQPKINLQSDTICGVEALVRMRDIDGRIVTPDEFIPIAENSNLILKIGEWVLERATQLSIEWAKIGLNIPISINISDVQFKNSASLLSTLHKIVSENPERPSNLILEISENIITHDVELASTLLKEIQDYGFQLSIDGFGSGFSSLSVLKELKVDEIKIDRHFLKGVPIDQKSTAILNAMIILGKSMGFRVVVMGVENPEQFEIIKLFDCDEFQGFLISEPIASDEFLNWLQKYNAISA